tara:strand:+ start:1973 stop:2206 length:234 start_codon:yes stop_codon:yes gene_type:complete
MTNVDSSFSLISSQHPDLDIGSPQLVDSLGHSFLQLILDSSGASKIETLLNQLSSILDQVLAIDETSRGIEVYFLPA